MTPERVLLFLDIDGVLHPYFTRQNEPDPLKAQFCYLPRLEAVIREFAEVRIVIASDWRKHHSIEELRSFFSPDIAPRIVGVTPLQPETPGALGGRQRQAEAYLMACGCPDARWIALDDEWDNYLANAAVIRCDDGFEEAEEVALRAALHKAREGPRKEAKVNDIRSDEERVLAAATALSGDRDRAAVWYRTHALKEFNGKTPAELVASGRADDVLIYIRMLEAGSSG